MYRGELHFREFLVAEQRDRLRLAGERFARLEAASPRRVGADSRLSKADSWAAAWRWPHEGGHWQPIHKPGHWQWPHTGGHWQSPHGLGHAH